MGWVKSLVTGFILVTVVLSVASGLAAYLFVTHQSCSPGPSAQPASSSASSAAPFAPVPVAADLVLAPLGNLTVVQGAPPDLAEPGFWGEVGSSQLRAYEEIVPQTVLGFFNSSEEWRAWAAQHVSGSPGWMGTGFVAVAAGQVAALYPKGNETAVAVERGVDGFAASADGLTLASIDYLTFNGLSGLRTLFETGDPLLAACQTLPGQLAQLYESSFDPSVPQAQRADYLGRALAITSVMLLVGGKDGIADHFRTALSGVGLGDAWPAVKPYLGDIASKVSAGASSATFGILQTLAGRFPQDSTFVTGFTADRVDSMVSVLEKKGVPDGQVQGDIQQIAQAAESSSHETGAGDEADVLSLQQGGGIQVTVQDDGTLVRYDDGSGEKATLDGLLLQEILPGFDPRGPEFVAIHCEESGVTIYRYYPAKSLPAGGPYSATQTNWRTALPSDVAHPGDTITISPRLLDVRSFIESIPPIPLENEDGIKWVADFSEAKGFALVDGQIQVAFEQEPFEGVSSFTITGKPMPLTYARGDTSLEFAIPNRAFQPRILKVTFDGYGNPSLSIESGQNFNPVNLVSLDGVRLKLVSDSGGGLVAVSTVYLQDPSVLYSPTPLAPIETYDISRATQVYQISQVKLNRALERSILKGDSTYDIGIVGAEIAYTIGEKNLGLTEVQMPAPSKGGADLYTADGSVVMQARMLANPMLLGDNLHTILSGQLQGMVRKVTTDFRYHTGATVGYAILSYVDPTTGVVKTLVAVVPKP